MAAEERGGSGVALVTGAARGIGFEVARQLAGEGLDARAKTLDVADRESVRRLAAEVDEEFGCLDVLVNNAAAFAGWYETASTADLESSRQVLDTNLFGAWRVCQACLPLIQGSGHGRIVNVSSGAGSHGEPRFGLAAGGGSAASYAISKAALNALTSKLAVELEGTGVLVNSVDPGLTATYLGAEAMGARPVEDGASGVVWAATLAGGGPAGGSIRDGEPLPW